MPQAAEARTDLTAQLAQVDGRIADCLASRAECERRRFSQSTWRLVNARLHNLYVLQHEIRKELEALPDPRAALFAEVRRIQSAA